LKRKVYRINNAGSLNNLKLVEEELFNPSDNEVTVEVKAIGLNFADLFAIQGLYSATPKESFIPGLEYSGIIVQKGKDVKSFSTGDKILGAIRFGAYATHLNINQKYILHLPDGYSFEEGAATLVQPLTAYYSLFTLGNLKPIQNVLIHSAAGGVGIYANRIAKSSGAYTIGTIGNDSKRDFLLSEGYDDIIVRDRHFGHQLRNALGNKKLNLVLESIGGKVFLESFKALAPSGRIIIYGGAQFMSKKSRPNYFKLTYQYLTRPKIDPLSLSDKNRSVMGFNLIYLWDHPGELKEMLVKILSMNLKKPHIGEVFDFNNLIDALKLFQSGKTIGKVVVKV
jgi:alcohol dehydrogenase